MGFLPFLLESGSKPHNGHDQEALLTNGFTIYKANFEDYSKNSSV